MTFDQDAEHRRLQRKTNYDAMSDSPIGGNPLTAPTNADDDDLAEPLKRAKTSIQRELESAVLDFCERHGLIDMVMGNWKLERHLSYPDLATERLTITIKLPDDWMDPDTERAETRTPRPTDPPV